MVNTKHVILAIALWACTIRGQNLVGQPVCAATCLKPAILKNCAAEDVGCQCGSGKAGIQADATTCLVAACSAADLALALAVGNALCSSYSAAAPLSPTNVGKTTSTTSSPATVSASSSNIITRTVSSSRPPSSVPSKITVPESSSSGILPNTSPSIVSSNALLTLTIEGSTISTASASPSSDTTTPSGKSESSLSGGAKAGIAIGVVFIAALAALVAWLCLRRRKCNVDTIAHRVEDSGIPELQTAATTYEIDGRGCFEKGQLRDASAYNKAQLLYMGANAELEAIPGAGQEEPRNGTQRPHPSEEQHNRGNTMLISQNILSPAELESSEKISNNNNSMSGPSSTRATAEGQGDSKLEILRARIERVRMEQERLKRLQELEELEGSLKAEIMTEQRKQLENEEQR
ncbi:hypothetical protein BGZ60DRAFT_436925 [Tricladium varicosporioides]|nr:hypothetical protein BGZ60DRAFT_436925 [Hymenoscyphus varicosporioides]